jgi:hypothetical protein
MAYFTFSTTSISMGSRLDTNSTAFVFGFHQIIVENQHLKAAMVFQ